MCGIVGFTGNRQAAPILLDGLSKLEYRGYDSAGLAVRDGENLAQVVKAKGRLSNLIEKTDGGKALKGTCGIGHTRWATHGEPSQTNAHPHVSGNCTRSGSGTVESEVVGVHNGIIENYTELKEKLLKHGYTFYSQTDTEVVIKLVDYYYKKYNLGPIDAIAKTMVRVRGSYALELMFRDYPGEIWVARKDSPMIIGVADGKSYCQISNPTLVNNEVDLGITNANKGKSRAITHSFGIKLRALMLGEEVEITFCDVQGTKKIYKFTEVERMSFVLFGILYASRCNNFHGNVAARMNSINANKDTFKMYTDMFLTEYIILAIHLNSQGVLSDVVLNKVKENVDLMI